MLYLPSEHFVVIRSQKNTIFLARSLRGRHFFDIFFWKKWIFSETIEDFSISFFLFFSLRKALKIIPNNMVSQSNSLDSKWKNVSHGPIFRIFFVFWLAPIEILKNRIFFFTNFFFQMGSTYLGGTRWFCEQFCSTIPL